MVGKVSVANECPTTVVDWAEEPVGVFIVPELFTDPSMAFPEVISNTFEVRVVTTTEQTLEAVPSQVIKINDFDIQVRPGEAPMFVAVMGHPPTVR